MALYKIVWKRSAKKELKRLDKQIIIRILQAVGSLAEDPLRSGSKKLIGRALKLGSEILYVEPYKIHTGVISADVLTESGSIPLSEFY